MRVYARRAGRGYVMGEEEILEVRAVGKEGILEQRRYWRRGDMGGQEIGVKKIWGGGIHNERKSHS